MAAKEKPGDPAPEHERIVRSASVTEIVRRPSEIAWRLRRVHEYLMGKPGAALEDADLWAVRDACTHYQRVAARIERQLR